MFLNQRRFYMLAGTLWFLNVALLIYILELSAVHAVAGTLPFTSALIIFYLKDRQYKLFLKDCLHDLRTPLTSVCGIAEIFQDRFEKDQDKKFKELNSILLSSSASIKSIINRMPYST